MTRPSRRQVLAGAGIALSLTAAGCLEETEDSEAEPTDNESDSAGGDDESTGAEQTTDWRETVDIPDELVAGLSYLYEPEESAVTALTIVDTAEVGGWAVPDGDFEQLFEEEPPLDWAMMFALDDAETTYSPSVLVGDIEVEEDVDGTEYGSFTVYESTDGSDEMVLAIDEDIVLVGERDSVETVIDRHDEGVEPYIAQREDVRETLDAITLGHHTSLAEREQVLEDIDSESVGEDIDDVDVEPDDFPALFASSMTEDDDEIRWQMAGRYEEPVDEATAEDFETIAVDVFGFAAEPEEIDRRTDGKLVVVDIVESYIPPEDQPETPGIPRFDGYDEDNDELLFRFASGDHIPVEYFDIEIADEPYEGDWARGHDTIGEDTVIGFDADAIEPGDTFTLRYDNPDVRASGASSTSILNYLPFELSYDPDEETAELTYVEGPPLPADQLAIELSDDREDDEPETRQLSTNISRGDTVTLENVPLESRLVVVYERSDGDSVSLTHHQADPPGQFTFEYDGEQETLTVTYPEDEQSTPPRGGVGVDVETEPDVLDADRYEVRIDGEPAADQWSDVGERIEPGDELAVSGVPVGVEAAVVWLGEDETVELRTHTVVPDATFEFDFENETLTIRHETGQVIDADALTVEIHGKEEQTKGWDTTDTVQVGDELTLTDVDEHATVIVRYNDAVLTREHVHSIAAEEISE